MNKLLCNCLIGVFNKTGLLTLDFMILQSETKMNQWLLGVLWIWSVLQLPANGFFTEV